MALLVACTTALLVVNDRKHEDNSPRSAVASNSVLQQWWARAQDDFNDLRNASAEVDQVFEQFRPAILVAACHYVHDAAEVGLQSDLPSPNPRLTAELHAAIEDFHSAAHFCLAKLSGSRVNYDGEFFSAIAEANRHMQKAQNLLNKLLTDV